MKIAKKKIGLSKTKMTKKLKASVWKFGTEEKNHETRSIAVGVWCVYGIVDTEFAPQKCRNSDRDRQ